MIQLSFCPTLSNIWCKKKPIFVISLHDIWKFGQLKGVQIKTLGLIICCAHISASINLIFKILVPTPIIYPQLCQIHNKFEDQLYRRWDMSTTKIQKQGFFFLHTLYNLTLSDMGGCTKSQTAFFLLISNEIFLVNLYLISNTSLSLS